ncbi:MAG: imelysin family protein [Gammaproteobacteria bacterium]|jgi:predicted lipoprotein
MSSYKPILILILFILYLPGVDAATPEESFLYRIKQEILLPDTDGALAALARIESAVQSLPADAGASQLAPARQAFGELVRRWKAVEAVYIAGALDQEYLDHPGYIDHFHRGNESPAEAVSGVLRSKAPLEQAMFKSSSKGIDALEYLLFAESDGGARRWQAASIAVEYIGSRLAEIDGFYRRDTSFEDGDGGSLKMLVHALVDSSYRLAEWRVGDPGGFTGKYKGAPDVERLEYWRSGLSMVAIESILATHEAFFEIGRETGYFLARLQDKGLEEIDFQRSRIEAAQELAHKLSQQSGVEVTSADFHELYKLLDTVYRTYYFLLADALGVEGKIMESDGD